MLVQTPRHFECVWRFPPQVLVFKHNKYKARSKKTMCFDLDTGECNCDIKPGASFHDTVRPSGYRPNKAYNINTPAEWLRFREKH